MKDMIWLVIIAFIVNNPQVIATHTSPSIMLICKEISFLFNTVIWLVVKQQAGTNQNVLKWLMNYSWGGLLCQLTHVWWVESIGECHWSLKVLKAILYFCKEFVRSILAILMHYQNYMYWHFKDIGIFHAVILFSAKS